MKATGSGSNAGGAARWNPWLVTLWLAAWVFLVAVQWRVIDRFGGSTPYLDQWDAEIGGVVVPLAKGQAIDWWRAHNEHRLVLTRVTTWALLRLNQDVWDPKLEQVAGALLFAAGWITWGLAWARHRGRRHQLGAAVVVALAGALPFGYENLLWGFQNQFAWLLWGGGLVALGLSCHASWKKVSVVAAGLMVSLLAMGSGGLAGAALVLTVLCRHRTVWPREREAQGLLLLGMLAVGGLLLTRTVVAGHAMLRPDDLGTACMAMLRCLSWPWRDVGWIGIVLWWPVGWWLVRGLRGGVGGAGDPAAPMVEVTTFAAAWAVLQLLALVASRGVPLAATGPTSRYTGLLIVGLLAGGAAAVSLLGSVATTRRRVGRLLFAAWVALVVVGAAVEGWRLGRTALPSWAARSEAQAQRLRAFWVSDDPGLLSGQPVMLTGYPDGDRLVTWLRDPVVRDVVAFSIWADPRTADDEMPRLSRWARVTGGEGWTTGLIAVAVAVWGAALWWLSRHRASTGRT